MRQLGLKPSAGRFRLVPACLLVLQFAGCKAAPEPSPAEASSPATPPAGEAPPPAAPPASEPAPEPPDAPPGAPAPLGNAAGSERTYAEGTKSISAKVGERFAVALPANITIPMKWRIEPAPDAKVLTLTQEQHADAPPKGCDGCTGYGGTRLFTFEAKGAGKTSLHFALKPLTNPSGASQKDVTIEVVTTP